MKTLTLLLLVASSFPVGHEDQQIRTRAMDEVPTSLRAEFQSTLIAAIDAQANGNWKAIYGMQWPKTLESESRETFTNAHLHFELSKDGFSVVRVDQTTLDASKLKDGTWTILGCAKFSKINHSQPIEAMTTIYLVDGHWYAQDIRPMLEMESAKTFPCKISGGIDPKALFIK